MAFGKSFQVSFPAPVKWECFQIKWRFITDMSVQCMHVNKNCWVHLLLKCTVMFGMCQKISDKLSRTNYFIDKTDHIQTLKTNIKKVY